MLNKNNRRVAIICWNSNSIQQVAKTYETLKDEDCVLYVKDGIDVSSIDAFKVFMPAVVDTPAKAKNYVIQNEKDTGNDEEWLHVVEDTIDVIKDPHSFMDDIEQLMKVMDINSWLSTVTDGCNRVFAKYCPRLKITVDDEKCQKFNLKEVIYCSHSNTQWMVFNLKNGDADELHFNEDFKIAMFWIIEYLARRRNTHPGSMYFMNQYLTIPSELGTFINVEKNESDKEIESKEQMAAEDAKFKAMNINYAADNNIDAVLEKTYLKLHEKAKKEQSI